MNYTFNLTWFDSTCSNMHLINMTNWIVLWIFNVLHLILEVKSEPVTNASSIGVLRNSKNVSSVFLQPESDKLSLVKFKSTLIQSRVCCVCMFVYVCVLLFTPSCHHRRQHRCLLTRTSNRRDVGKTIFHLLSSLQLPYS